MHKGRLLRFGDILPLSFYSMFLFPWIQLPERSRNIRELNLMDPKIIILNQNDLGLMSFSSTGTGKFELLFM